ncbi:transposase [Streptomyces sp. LBL]|nr:transposase [Streptomyces sp. LBL]
MSALVVEDVVDGGDAVVVTARTRDVAVLCPVCGTPTAKVHGYHRRTVTDVPVDGRPVVDHLRVRRPVCPALDCWRQTFREQIPGLLERHQRRTVRLAWQISQVARELCGRAAARLARLLAVPMSRSTALRGLPLPQQVIPWVIGVDDFALRRPRYATSITDTETGRRVAVLPDRERATLESWLNNRSVRSDHARNAAGAPVAAAEAQHTAVPAERTAAKMVHTLAREVMVLDREAEEVEALIVGCFREHPDAAAITGEAPGGHG